MIPTQEKGYVMPPKVSVIMPVYNTAEFLGQSLDTVLLQTLQDIEVICVDDGSTDDSLSILNTYAMLDDRLKVIHQENAGLGPTRNRGLKEATGEFVIFLDSDDFFDKEMLEKMLQKIEQDGSDMAICGVSVFDHQTQKERNKVLLDTHLVSMSPISPKDHPDDLFFCAAWTHTKLIKRDLLIKHNLQCPNLIYQQDIPFMYPAMALANKISLLPDAFVHYRINRGHQLTDNMNDEIFYLPWINLWNNLKKYDLNKYYSKSYKKVFFENFLDGLRGRTLSSKRNVLGSFHTLGEIQDILCDNVKTKISIIICAYNGAKFLRKCLDSCLNQSLKEIEIICVDDGSTDTTLEIFSEYAQKDKRFKVIHQENQGLPISRNNATKLASGEYLEFLDADDWLEPDTCECLYMYAKTHNLDMLSFPAKSFTDKARAAYDDSYLQLLWLPRIFVPIFTWKDIVQYLPHLAVTAPLTIYRHKYLIDNNIEWINKKVVYEDTPFFLESLSKGARMGALKIPFYQKRIHAEAISSNIDKNYPDYCWICQYTLKKLYKQMGYSKFFVSYFNTFMLKLYGNYRNFNEEVKKQMLPHLYRFCLNTLKLYHLPLQNELIPLCKMYLRNKSLKKKLEFVFLNKFAIWRQSGYTVAPLKFSLRPFSISIFGIHISWPKRKDSKT